MVKPETRSFRTVLVEVDTSAVDKIIIHPKKSNSSFDLVRSESGWTVSDGGKTYPATSQSVMAIMTIVNSLPPQQLVSRSKEKWTEYEVDENGTRVELFSGAQQLDDFYVGRFNFDQMKRSATSYLRKASEDDIYAVDGFLSMTFDQDINGFRNKKLAQGLTKDNLNNIQFNGPETQISFNQTNGLWERSDGITVDSSKMANYLTAMLNKVGGTPAAGISQMGGTPVESLTFNNGAVSFSIYANPNKEGEFLINSNKVEDLIFESNETGLYKTLISDLLQAVE